MPTPGTTNIVASWSCSRVRCRASARRGWPGGPMKDIRNLLLDCRTALRRIDKNFEDSPLADRLGEAIIGISRQHEPPPPSEVPQARPHAQRIAYAWQAAARELRATHPEVHALLSKRVMERLGEEVLDAAGDELEPLPGNLRLREAAHPQS